MNGGFRMRTRHAARGGLLAAQMAQRGVADASFGLEGPKAFLRSLAGLQDIPAQWREDPALEGILSVWAKPWATLGDNMSAVIAATLLHEEQQDSDQIEKVHIRIWRHFTEYPGTAYRGPFDRIAQAVASMAFGTAAALVYGEIEYDKPSNHRNDARILRLVDATTIEPDDDGTPYDATVTITCRNRRILVRKTRDAGTSSLFHDRGYAIQLFVTKCVRSGLEPAVVTAIATKIMRTVGNASTMKIRELVYELS